MVALIAAVQVPLFIRLLDCVCISAGGDRELVNPDTWDARDHEVDLDLFLRLERLLCQWLVTLAEVLAARGISHSGHTEIDDRVRAVIDRMHASDLAEPLDVERLAKEVGLSQNHLIRLFRRDLQTTPSQYWDRLRIEHARSRLLQPDARVKEIGSLNEASGFLLLSHFAVQSFPVPQQAFARIWPL